MRGHFQASAIPERDAKAAKPRYRREAAIHAVE
jgi:hypothetical protein